MLSLQSPTTEISANPGNLSQTLVLDMQHLQVMLALWAVNYLIFNICSTFYQAIPPTSDGLKVYRINKLMSSLVFRRLKVEFPVFLDVN